MTFQISGLSPAPFQKLFQQQDYVLEHQGIIPVLADSKPGFPCRVGLRDAEQGERILLLNYMHLADDTPYRASHAIFVAEESTQAHALPGEVPEMLRRRLLSVRGFDNAGLMTTARVTEGSKAGDVFEEMLANSATKYLHVHTAARGCFLAAVQQKDF